MKNEQKKILILVNDLSRGGAQRIIFDIAKNINRNEFSLIIGYFKESSKSGVETFKEDIIRTGTAVTWFGGQGSFRFKEIFGLWRLIHLERPDVIHTFLPYAGILGRVIGRAGGIGKIMSTQCNLPLAYKKTIYFLDILTLSVAGAWTAATEGIEEYYGNSAERFSRSLWEKGRRHFTVFSGVDISEIEQVITSMNRTSKRKELNLPENAKIVTMIARLISWKGHGDIISAMTILPNDVHLLLVGWGPLREELGRIAKEKGVSNRVHFLGSRNDAYQILTITDVYAQTHPISKDGSVWIGPNLSQIEACAALIPSVSTKVPRIEDLIENGVTGLLAEPNNPRDLARAILWMLEHKSEAKKLADAARKRVEERYSLSSMINSYESLYKILAR